MQSGGGGWISSSKAGTLGRHLARRLVQVGVTDVFSVPGDFNLTLLDHLIDEPSLNLVGCCNELNAGYAADGYARARGVGACVVTFTVGGLSVINAIAGSYSENLPIICIVGGPNSNDYGTNRILHHTIGLPDFSQELRCFQTVTCFQAVVNNLEDAHEQIDTAISTALKESKPVYISISCNLPGVPHSTFRSEPVPYFLAPKQDITAAAMRACRDAITSNSVPAFRTGLIPGVSYEQMKLQIKLGVPLSTQQFLDIERVKSIFPYGQIISFEVMDGGMICSSGVCLEAMGDKNDDCYVVNAAGYVGC